VEDAGERDQDFLIGNPVAKAGPWQKLARDKSGPLTKAGDMRRAWELPSAYAVIAPRIGTGSAFPHRRS
jgi:hypothetical protein